MVSILALRLFQVHRAVLHSGEVVAVKVQYPGVAKSINSDINNLLSILKVWQILPKGQYLNMSKEGGIYPSLV